MFIKKVKLKTYIVIIERKSNKFSLHGRKKKLRIIKKN